MERTDLQFSPGVRVQTKSPRSVCLLQHKPLGTTVVGLYVDDVIVIAQDNSLSDTVMQKVHEKFEINDLGLISKCLDINVETTEYGYLLQQQHNIDALLAKVEMDNCATRSTPMDEKHKLYDRNLSLF